MKSVMSIVFICLLQLLCTVSGQQTPAITYVSQQKVVSVGGSAELVCSVHFARDYSVLWMKLSDQNGESAVPISSGSTLIVPDQRFALRHTAASNTYTLQIKDIQEADAGVYQCQILITLQNRISADVELLVRMPPVISDNSTRSLVVSEGESVKLQCFAAGFPPPKVSWRRQNNELLPTGGSVYRGSILKINNVRKENRGTYYCVADNNVGQGVRRNVALDVEFAPEVSVPRPRLAQALGYDMDLECHVEAYPPPAIMWLKDGNVLTNNQHYRISEFASNDEFTSTTLRVLTIEKKQYGHFECEARNKLGSNKGRVELIEVVLPVCPPACNPYNTGSSGATVVVSFVLQLASVLLALCIHF